MNRYREKERVKVSDIGLWLKTEVREERRIRYVSGV
jgi:hypothetical protein